MTPPGGESDNPSVVETPVDDSQYDPCNANLTPPGIGSDAPSVGNTS
jgi:hypothetical protein